MAYGSNENALTTVIGVFPGLFSFNEAVKLLCSNLGLFRNCGTVLIVMLASTAPP